MALIVTERPTTLTVSHAVHLDPDHPVLVVAHARRRPKPRVTRADREAATAQRMSDLLSSIRDLRIEYMSSHLNGNAGLALRSLCHMLGNLTGQAPEHYAPEAF